LERPGLCKTLPQLVSIGSHLPTDSDLPAPLGPVVAFQKTQFQAVLACSNLRYLDLRQASPGILGGMNLQSNLFKRDLLKRDIDRDLFGTLLWPFLILSPYIYFALNGTGLAVNVEL
jgi:hypothetical protein